MQCTQRSELESLICYSWCGWNLSHQSVSHISSVIGCMTLSLSLIGPSNPVDRLIPMSPPDDLDTDEVCSSSVFVYYHSPETTGVRSEIWLYFKGDNFLVAESERTWVLSKDE